MILLRLSGNNPSNVGCPASMASSVVTYSLTAPYSRKKQLLAQQKRSASEETDRYGPSVIIGSGKNQSYQWFAGSKQEVLS